MCLVFIVEHPPPATQVEGYRSDLESVSVVACHQDPWVCSHDVFSAYGEQAMYGIDELTHRIQVEGVVAPRLYESVKDTARIQQGLLVPDDDVIDGRWQIDDEEFGHRHIAVLHARPVLQEHILGLHDVFHRIDQVRVDFVQCRFCHNQANCMNVIPDIFACCQVCMMPVVPRCILTQSAYSTV